MAAVGASAPQAKGRSALTVVPRYLQRFDSTALPHVFCDVLVIGSGIAGNIAALEAARAGARTLLLTKGEQLESNTLYAQGGIAAALEAADSVDAHGDDTLLAGAGLCDESVVREVIGEAPAAVAGLQDLGVAFDQTSDAPSLHLGREGGHSFRRIAHSQGDGTGRAIQLALAEQLAASPDVRVVTGAFAVDLLTTEDGCAGALVQYRREFRIVRAGAVVLATGGAGRLFRESTNPAVSTGDGIAMAYRAGARVRDLEFMQFHPTVLYLPGAARMLLSEAARGEGALILDQRGERFLPSIDERAELAPRDVVCRAIVGHLLAHGDTHALLDLRGIPEARLRDHLPGVVATGRAAGIDVRREPLPVRPAAHYTIGGVASDIGGRTNVPRLFVAGEVAATGLHGANRLASNSLLEGYVMGARSGRAAAALADGARTAPPVEIRSAPPGRGVNGLDAGDIGRSVASLVWRLAGVMRERDGLLEALSELDRWSRVVMDRQMSGAAGMESQNLTILAGLVAEAALRREETRGVHWRNDFPETDDERFRGNVVQQLGAATVTEPLPVFGAESAA